MFCPKCGAENSNKALFCEHCGTNLSDPETKALAEKKQQVPWKRYMGLLVSLLAVVLIVVLIVNSRKVNLDSYVYVEYSGYDGYGSANAYVDWNELYATCENLIDKKYFKKSISEASFVEAMEDIVEIEILDNSYLTNDEIIKYQWKIDDSEISKVFKRDVVYAGGENTVSGLKELETFNPFDELRFDVSGTSGKARLHLFSDGIVPIGFFEVSDELNLKNGQVITVSLTKDIDYYVEKFHKLPESMEFQYTVSGLNEYAKKIDEIDEETKQEMLDDANNYLKNYIEYFEESNYSSYFKYGIKDTYAEFLGDAFMSTQSENEEYTNMYILLFEVGGTYYDNYTRKSVSKEYKTYLPICYIDIVDVQDGKDEVDTVNKRITDDYVSIYVDGFKKIYPFGYETLQEAKTVVFDNRDMTFDGEWNVEE